jgi:RloB-like protein
VHEYNGVDPRALVERAAQEKRHEAKEARRGRGDAHDQIWCVFDVDEHARLAEAVDMAAANQIEVGVSNPCFELWLILHFQEQAAPIERDEAQRIASGLLGCGKSLTPKALTELIASYEDAIKRARRLEAMHVENGSPERSSPSSGVWRLVNEIAEKSGR